MAPDDPESMETPLMTGKYPHFPVQAHGKDRCIDRMNPEDSNVYREGMGEGTGDSGGVEYLSAHSVFHSEILWRRMIRNQWKHL